MIRRLVAVALFAIAAQPVPLLRAAAPRSSAETYTGELAGAQFTIVKPSPWNGNLLIHAHGYRAESAPLSAKLDASEPTYARLVADGWMLAATSYRRNGMVVRDAIADINALRDHIERTEGSPGLVLLMGESMGGGIVTLIAENEPDRFHGAVAIGAALQVRDPIYPLAFTHAPKIPVIFLTNRSEIEGPAAYVERAAGAPVRPALWTVDRDGHVNVNHDERTLAIEGLITWITTNQIDRRRDVTVEDASIESTARFADNAAYGTVWSITANYGNIFTTFVPEDLARLAIKPGDDFLFEASGGKWTVRYGSDYGDVPAGAWIAFPRAEGVILIARNQGNAAITAGLAEGDPISVRPVARH